MNPLANLPPQPVFSPGDASYSTRFNEWVTLANQAMTSYRAEYESAMADQGIRVQWDTPAAVISGPFSVPPTYNATLTKDGFSTVSTVSIGRGQSTDPRDLASFDQTFNLKYQASAPSGAYQMGGGGSTLPQLSGYASGANQGGLPSSWFLQNPATVNPFFSSEPTSTPGPATTTPVSNVTLQPAQTPQNPDPGTIVTTPEATASTPAASTPILRYNLWEWNWFYEQETSRVGPPPEAVGISDPRALMTRAEWWAKVSGWYANTSNGSITPPVGGGGGGGTGIGNGTGGTITDPIPGTGNGGAPFLPGSAFLNGILPLAAGLVLVMFLAKASK